jgi:hypothetical protein
MKSLLLSQLEFQPRFILPRIPSYMLDSDLLSSTLDEKLQAWDCRENC